MQNEIPSIWLHPVLHSTYQHIFCDYVAAKTSLPVNKAIGSPRLLPFMDFVPLLDALSENMVPEEGIDIGLNYPSFSHGAMGFAATTSATLSEAMQAIARFNPFRNQMHLFRYQEDADVVRLKLDFGIDLGAYKEVVDTGVLFANFNILRAVFPPDLIARAVIHLPSKRSTDVQIDYYQPMSTIVWNSHQLAFEFPRELGDTTNLFGEETVYRSIVQVGEEELVRTTGNISSKVRYLLNKSHPQWLTAAEVASDLAMSESTLLRRLAKENITFQELLDEARGELACWYLAKTDLPLGEIASRIGFSDQTNFSRFFNRLKSATPAQYRRISLKQD